MQHHAALMRTGSQQITYSQALDYSSLLAKTSKEIDEIHKQQRDSSRDVSKISTIVARLDTTVKCSIDRHFQEIQKSFESELKLIPGISDLKSSLSGRINTRRRAKETAGLAQ